MRNRMSYRAFRRNAARAAASGRPNARLADLFRRVDGVDWSKALRVKEYRVRYR